MPDVHIMYGQVRSRLPAIRPVNEEVVSSGSNSGEAPVGTGFARVKYIDGAVYVGVTGEAGRARLDAAGEFVDLDVAPGETITVTAV